LDEIEIEKWEMKGWESKGWESKGWESKRWERKGREERENVISGDHSNKIYNKRNDCMY